MRIACGTRKSSSAWTQRLTSRCQSPRNIFITLVLLKSIEIRIRVPTNLPSASSITQEKVMGFVGATLSWEHRISSVAREGKAGVEPSERESQGNPAAVNPEDAALAASCRAGDLHAYERLYRLQGARMRNLARNLLGTQSDAEDAVQETFLKVQRSIASFRGQSSFVTWTFRILVNTCHDLRRSRTRRKEIVPEEREEGG